MQVDGDCCQLSSSGDDGEDVGGYSKDRYISQSMKLLFGFVN